MLMDSVCSAVLTSCIAGADVPTHCFVLHMLRRGAACAQAQAATQAFPPQVEHVLLDFVGLAVPAADHAAAGRRVATIVRGLMQRRAPAPCTARARYTSVCLSNLQRVCCGAGRPSCAASCSGAPPLLALRGHSTHQDV